MAYMRNKTPVIVPLEKNQDAEQDSKNKYSCRARLYLWYSFLPFLCCHIGIYYCTRFTAQIVHNMIGFLQPFGCASHSPSFVLH